MALGKGGEREGGWEGEGGDRVGRFAIMYSLSESTMMGSATSL